MADSDQSLEILIKSVLDSTGYRMNEKEAKKLQGTLAATGALSQNMGAKMAEAGKEGEHAAHGLFESHREVHKLIDTIGNEAVPGMGQAFAALAHGPLGALIAIGLVVEGIKKSIAQTNEQLDAISANASKAFGGGDSITNYVEAVSQAAMQTEALAEALRKASDAGPEITNRYNAEATAIKEIVDAIKAKLKAQEESDLVEAAAAAKRAGASPGVAQATEAEIKARYESRGKAAEDAAEQALQQARGRELAERETNKPALESAAAAQKTPARVAATRTDRANELQAQEAALDKATSELNTAANNDLNEKIEAYKAGLEHMRQNGTRAYIIKNRESEIAVMESQTAENREADAKDRIKQLSKQVLNDQANAAKEKTALEEATTAATENAKRIVDLQKEIADANTAAKIKAEPLAALVRGLNPYEDTKTFEKTAGVDTDAGAADFVNKFLVAQSRLGSRHGTKDDSQTVALMNTLLQETKQSDGKTFELLSQLIAHHGNLNGKLESLQRELKNVIHRTDRPQS